MRVGGLLAPVQKPLEIAGMIALAPLAGDMGMMGKAVSWLGRGGAASAVAGTTARVLGHHPEYLQVGEAIGAKVFDIPPKAWRAMSEAAQWAANRKFLARGISEGAEFVMATPRSDIRAGSDLAEEVQYLLKRGYEWAEDGLSLIPK
jgi:hypothetical protein